MAKPYPIIFLVVAAFGSGLQLGIALSHYSERLQSVSPEASINPLSEHASATMPTTDVVLHFLDAEKWRETKVAKNVDGFTVNGSPCQVYLPAKDFGIQAEPRWGLAHWTDGTDNTLPHEILHCLRGVWHRPWPEILADSTKEKLAQPTIVNNDLQPAFAPSFDYALVVNGQDWSTPILRIVAGPHPSIDIAPGVSVDDGARKLLYALRNAGYALKIGN